MVGCGGVARGEMSECLVRKIERIRGLGRYRGAIELIVRASISGDWVQAAFCCHFEFRHGSRPLASSARPVRGAPNSVTGYLSCRAAVACHKYGAAYYTETSDTVSEGANKEVDL